ncbi:MAG: hypothetical protein RLZZ224_1092 [Verrucomicrobiota bacterium]|jgi:hypothetical protein
MKRIFTLLTSLLSVLCVISIISVGAQEKPVPEKSAKQEQSTSAKSTVTNPRPGHVEQVNDAVEDEEADAEKKEAEDTIKVARPVSSDPVQIYGWREKVRIAEMPDHLNAKLDTGAMTSSLHAENQQLFERDGKKWVKFVLTDPNKKDSKRYDIEAPLSRLVLIKEPGGQSVRRNVVRLSFQLGDRKIKSEFTLNNRNNMTCPVLIGLKTIQVLGWVDPTRTYLADDKIFR